jgi:acyl-CoA synthetase (AMP-forming)/AMP-acid ligase II
MSFGATACLGCGWMPDLLSDFRAAVARHPERVAIVDGRGTETTFADLKVRADGLARAWASRGVGAGDRVLLAMRLDADLYAALAALWSLGATVVLPEPAMGLSGLRHAARVTAARAFCSSGAYGLLKYALPELWPCRHLRPREAKSPRLNHPLPAETDMALISFTSGTSGAPKAIPRSHGFLSAQHRAVAPLLHSDAPERDLVAFPVFVLINIAEGRTSILPNWRMSKLARLAPRALHDWIDRQAATRALLPPSLCEKLAMAGRSSGLRTVFTGGGPVFPDIVNTLTEADGGPKVVCVYGSTEAEPIAHLDAADISAADLDAMTAGAGLLVGPPVDEIRVRIVADEIQVAGAHVNEGYLDPKHDAENKVRDGTTVWHRTGDAGRLDETGRLWLMGRVGSEVAINDTPVFPFAIEVAARGWAGVVQCALTERSGAPCLVVEGDAAQLDVWRKKAAGFGISDVQNLHKIPMDRRHASKVDRVALRRQLG